MLQLPSTEAEQGSEVWRNERAGSVTGSGFKHVLATLKHKAGEAAARRNYRMQLVTERITGLAKSEMSAPALSWGKDNEAKALIAYEMWKAARGESVFVERVGFQRHGSLDWVGTSPDGFVGERGLVEVKCPFDSMEHLFTLIHASRVFQKALLNAEGSTLIAVLDEHIPQIQGNLWVTEREFCDFISFDPRMPEHLRLYVHRVYRDDAFIKKLEVEVLKFLDEVETNVGVLLLPEEIADTSVQKPVKKVAS